MSMVRYTRKELNENFSDKQDAEIKRLLAKGTVPDGSHPAGIQTGEQV